MKTGDIIYFSKPYFTHVVEDDGKFTYTTHIVEHKPYKVLSFGGDGYYRPEVLIILDENRHELSLLSHMYEHRLMTLSEIRKLKLKKLDV